MSLRSIVRTSLVFVVMIIPTAYGDSTHPWPQVAPPMAPGTGSVDSKPQSQRYMDARDRSGEITGTLWSTATDYPNVDPTGRSDSTAGLAQAIMSSAARGMGLRFPCGTYIVDNVPIASGAHLLATQGGCVLFRRRKDASSPYAMSATEVHGFIVDGISIDANAAENPNSGGTAMIISKSEEFSIRNLQTGGAQSIDGSNHGVGLRVSDCSNRGEFRISEVSGSRFAGELGNSARLTGILVERCQNLTITENISYGHRYSGIAVVDPTVPVPTKPTNERITISQNRSFENGVGIYVAGFTSGMGVGGLPIWSRDNFVNDKISVVGNHLYNNTAYGCVVQASDLTVAQNDVRNNGTGMTYGGCAIASKRFSIIGNNFVDNSYYGLDVGGSIQGTVADNTIHRNGKAFGAAIGLNIGAVTRVVVGRNDVGDNGGSHGGWEVLGSALDGSDAANFFPWTGEELTIKGLKITVTDPAMGGLRLFNGWKSVSVSNTTVKNTEGSSKPFDLRIAASELTISDTSVASSRSKAPVDIPTRIIAPPDGPGSGEAPALKEATPKLSLPKRDLNRGLREFVVSETGNGGYTAGAGAFCTSNNGVPATVNPARSSNGRIYGLYVVTPGSDASSMSCSIADQTCTAVPGSVKMVRGMVAKIDIGKRGAGCNNPPAVIIAGLVCAAYPQVFARVKDGEVSEFVVGYGGDSCTGDPTASVLNGAGFLGSALLGVDR